MFNVWEPRTRHGAQLVNEPGAWAMSRLDTPDPEGAAAFYGEVFGWTTEAFGPATMFRLPGYVGGEPEQPVSREVVAAMMAPAEAAARAGSSTSGSTTSTPRSSARERGGGTTVHAAVRRPRSGARP